MNKGKEKSRLTHNIDNESLTLGRGSKPERILFALIDSSKVSPDMNASGCSMKMLKEND